MVQKQTRFADHMPILFLKRKCRSTTATSSKLRRTCIYIYIYIHYSTKLENKKNEGERQLMASCLMSQAGRQGYTIAQSEETEEN